MDFAAGRRILSAMLTFPPIDRIFILAGAGVSAESGVPFPWHGCPDSIGLTNRRYPDFKLQELPSCVVVV